MCVCVCGGGYMKGVHVSWNCVAMDAVNLWRTVDPRADVSQKGRMARGYLYSWTNTLEQLSMFNYALICTGICFPGAPSSCVAYDPIAPAAPSYYSIRRISINLMKESGLPVPTRGFTRLPIVLPCISVYTVVMGAKESKARILLLLPPQILLHY